MFRRFAKCVETITSDSYFHTIAIAAKTLSAALSFMKMAYHCSIPVLAALAAPSVDPASG
jgi:hypothetical protein